jgi:hypothetical protein
MRKKLPIVCPSVGTLTEFFTEPCKRGACFGWVDGGCGEAAHLRDVYQKHLDKDPLPPPCPIKDTCRWHLDAVARGENACPPRRLGMLCEHQGGEWNTFQMAEPEEWDEVCQ